MTKLAQLIRHRRLQLRLTQREAAEHAGLSLATWQSLERPTSQPDGFQDLTLARAAHGLELPMQPIFDAAARPLPERDPLTGQQGPHNPERQTDPTAPSETDHTYAPDAMLEHLDELLRELLERSPPSFDIVYSQATETAQHLLELLPPDPAQPAPEDPGPDTS